MVAGNCALCGTYRWSLDRDHIVPKCKGGTDDSSNIQHICQNCHFDKTHLVDLVGIKRSSASRQRQSESAKRRMQNPAERAKVGAFFHGRKHSAQTIAKMQASAVRRFQDPDERVKAGNGRRGPEAFDLDSLPKPGAQP